MRLVYLSVTNVFALLRLLVVDPARAVGRWTGSAVREILRNPKYTGYMVWNRRASKKGGQYNPPSDWVWSPIPTHEPLTTKTMFEAAFSFGGQRQGSRVNGSRILDLTRIS
jgi:hypothetical protein